MTAMLRYIRPLFQNGGQIRTRGAKNTVEERLGLPSKPKKPNSVFISFLNSKRNDIVSNNPQAKPKDIVKIAAEMWRKVDVGAKAALTDQYKKDMDAYSSRLLDYENKLTAEQRQEIQEAISVVKEEKQKRRDRLDYLKKQRDFKRPIRPLTSFLLFCQAEANYEKGSKFTEISQRLGAQWAALPANKKAEYQRRADIAKERYEKELLAWEEKMIQEDHLDLVRQKTLDKWEEKKKK